MDCAIKDWLEETRDALDASGNDITHMETFSHIVQIPLTTFQKYVRQDPNNRRKITNAVGKKNLLSTTDQQFVADTIVWQYRSNNGLTCGDVIEQMIDIKPGLTKIQASNHLHGIMKNNHGDLLKKRVVVGQATTT